MHRSEEGIHDSEGSDALPVDLFGVSTKIELTNLHPLSYFLHREKAHRSRQQWSVTKRAQRSDYRRKPWS